MIFPTDKLNTALALLSKITPSKPDPFILGSILFAKDSNSQAVKLTAGNDKFYLQIKLPEVKFDALNSFAVPAKFLSVIVTQFSDSEVAIELDETNNFVFIKSDHAVFELSILEGEDYPIVNLVNPTQDFEISVGILNTALKNTVFIFGSDVSSNQILTGVNLKILQTGTLKSASTDTHRLAVIEINRQGEPEKPTFASNLKEDFIATIPHQTLKELLRITAKSHVEETVTIIANKTQVQFQFYDRVLTSRLLQGDYPQYEALIPQSFDYEGVINREKLLNALQLVELLTKANDLVNLNCDQKKQLLEITNDDTEGNLAIQTIDLNTETGIPDLLLNIKYLMQGLKAIATEEIMIKANGSLQPLTISPIDDLNAIYLLMPIQPRNR